MANRIDVKVIESGPRNVVLHVFMQSDGIAGDVTNYVLLRPSDIGLPTNTRFNLRQIDHSLAGFDCILGFDNGLIPTNSKWVLAEGANNPLCLDYMGGIKDDSGLDGDGALIISTLGFNSTADVGSLVIRLIR